MFNITYIGSKSGTSLQRANALARIGHCVSIVDPFDFLAPTIFHRKFVYLTGAAGARFYAYDSIYDRVSAGLPDLVWVDHGAFLGPELIRRISNLGCKVVNYMVDNPFADLYHIKCRNYRKSLPYYDCVVHLRDKCVDESYLRGARKVIRSHHAADEIAHSPIVMSADQLTRYESQVAFVGTWLPERGVFLKRLIDLDIPISIWGGRWSRAPEWNFLRPFWRGGELTKAEDYAASIQGARICIGLLSEQVEDQVTSRSFEIPALGGLLCAKRTSEHESYFRDGVEAVFWDTAEDCANLCLSLLMQEDRCSNIGVAGRERVINSGYYNEPMLKKIISQIYNND